MKYTYSSGMFQSEEIGMETFEKFTFINNLYDKLTVAEADLKADRVSDADEAISVIRKQYGL